MERGKQLLILFLLLLPAVGRAQMLSVNTDVVQDVLLTPNLGFELVTGERSTVGLNVFGNYRPWGVDMRIVGVQPEFRYFFSGRPMHGPFFGIGGIAASYDIHWKSKIYDGTAYGMGLTFGYVFSIAHRINVDCHAGFAPVFYRHKEYFDNDFYDDDFIIDNIQRPNARGYWLMPTRIGVSLSYILK